LAAGGELLKASSEPRPPFTHGSANAVLFHGLLQICDAGSGLGGLRRCDNRTSSTVRTRRPGDCIAQKVENASDSHGPLNVASCSLPPPAVRPRREYKLWWPSTR